MSDPSPHSDPISAPDEATRLLQTADQLRSAGRADEAIAAYQQAIALRPDLVAAYVNLGTVHATRAQWDEAVASFRQAVALAPDIRVLHYNYINALEIACLWDEGLAAAQRATQLHPNDAVLRYHLGLALYSLGRLDESKNAYFAALRIDPNLAVAHCFLGTLLHLQGDLPRCWHEYEWRWRAVEPGRRNPSFTDQNKWNGADLAGRRIILDSESGGFGDAIHYFRYAPLVAKRGGKVIVRCQPQLVRLFQTLEGVEQVISAEQPLPDFDLHCPLFSLPRVFETSLDTIPADIPYLRAEPAKMEHWKSRLAPVDDKRLDVGLVWAGGAINHHNRTRSINLARLAPLANAPGVRWISLQKGPPAREAQQPPPRMELIDWSAELTDWSDTAALLVNLDLLITVDTGVAHLAGALGVPVWVLLEKIPGPNYMLDRSDSPWYPTMHLFRQDRFGDWTKPIQDVIRALREITDKLP